MDWLDAILFWSGIVALVDGSLGLLFEERWQRLAGKLNIRRIALAETAVALALLTAHYFLRVFTD